MGMAGGSVATLPTAGIGKYWRGGPIADRIVAR